MEKECIQCRRKFYEEDETLQKCPQCRGEEFAAGRKLSAEECAELAKMQRKALKKRKTRANKRAHAMRYAMEFRPSGMLRCVLALVLFGICVFFFMISDGKSKIALAEVSYTNQLLLSLSCAVVSVALLLPSFKMHKFLISAASAIIIAVSALLPTLFQKQGFEHYLPTDTQAQTAQEAADQLRCLRDEDLEFLAKCARDYPDGVHYAIFMRMPDRLLKTETGSLKNIAPETQTVDLIKSSLARILHSDAVEHHRSKSGISGIGVYFTVCNSRLANTDVAELLQQKYGKIYYSSAEKGIYELYIDKELIHKQYDADQLADVLDADFVQRNVDALQALDTAVVQAAARRLADAGERVFSSPQAQEKVESVKVALRELLSQSWGVDRQAYCAVVEAMATYAPREVVAEDIFALWCKEPMVWNTAAGKLADRVESLMLAYLEEPARTEQESMAALSYLRQYGTSAALATLRSFSQHSSVSLRNMAAVAQAAIEQRMQQSE